MNYLVVVMPTNIYQLLVIPPSQYTKTFLTEHRSDALGQYSLVPIKDTPVTYE